MVCGCRYALLYASSNAPFIDQPGITLSYSKSIFIHSTPSIVSVVKHYLSLPSRTHQDPQTNHLLCTPTTLVHHPPLHEHRASFSGDFGARLGVGGYSGSCRGTGKERRSDVCWRWWAVCVPCGRVFDVPKSFLSCGLCTLRWMILLPSYYYRCYLFYFIMISLSIN